MIYTTTVHKTVTCPKWNTEIQLCGKYHLPDNITPHPEATFMYATCPIVENLNLPSSKQDKKYSLYRFCDKYPCELLKSFDPTIIL